MVVKPRHAALNIHCLQMGTGEAIHSSPYSNTLQNTSKDSGQLGVIMETDEGDR